MRTWNKLPLSGNVFSGCSIKERTPVTLENTCLSAGTSSETSAGPHFPSQKKSENVCLSVVSDLSDPMDCSPPGSSVHGDSPGKNTGVGCHTLLQGIFPIQGSNLGLLHYKQILYHLSHGRKVKMLVTQLCLTLCDPTDCGPPGSSVHGILQARILEWVAVLISRGSSWPRDCTRASRIAGRFFTISAAR